MVNNNINQSQFYAVGGVDQYIERTLTLNKLATINFVVVGCPGRPAELHLHFTIIQGAARDGAKFKASRGVTTTTQLRLVTLTIPTV